MNNEEIASLQHQFSRIGARLLVRNRPSSRGNGFSLDIGHDRKGEFFSLASTKEVELAVVDTKPKLQHLLLFTKTKEVKSHFLCGHDERHLFVAAIPEKAHGVSSVKSAQIALQPPLIQELASHLRPKLRQKHRAGDAYSRQGEWFFIPTPDLTVPADEILRNERLQRGRARPHFAEFCYRRGGIIVYVNYRYPNGVTAKEKSKLLGADTLTWRVMVKDAEVYVKGRITHEEHATRVLSFWHRVLPNTEGESLAMRNLAFLD